MKPSWNLFLWNLGLKKNICPFCGKKTLLRRDNSGIGREYYTCEDVFCEFNKR